MTDKTPEAWKDIPGCPGHQAGWDGNFRSLDRVTPSGRHLKGQPIPTRPSNKGYALVDLRDAEGKRVTRSAHSVILETFAGKCPDGMESRHYDDNPQNNRWRPGTEEESRARGGNLFWGTKAQNREDRRRNTPPAPPRPPSECVRCHSPFQGNGRRCHPCVEDVGRQASRLLTGGKTLAEAMKALDYPSAEGLHTLAVKYGDYGARKSWWSRTVKPKVVTLRSRVPGKRRSRTVTRLGVAPAARSETAPEGRKDAGGFRTNLGQSRTYKSQAVAQRDNTERNHPRPARSGVTRRSRLSRRKGRL